MNCANHPDRERAAFCQNCGKPLCNECVRNVGTSVFCEPCLAARVAATAPPTGYPRPGGPGYPPAGYPLQGAPGEPRPALAALLGLIPGVGAMYNEQYAKGIVHLMVFALLVSLTSDVNGLFLLFVFGWVAYMAIEAYHTAQARRDGTPLPNPFGLNDLSERLGFGRAWPGTGPVSTSTPGPVAYPAPDPGPANPVPAANPNMPPYGYTYVPPVSQWGAPQDPASYAVPQTPPIPPMPPYPDPSASYYHRFPSGAILLIALGLFFMVGNMHVFRLFHLPMMPFLLIGLGVWIFVRKMTVTGQGIEDDGTPMYRWRLGRAVSSSMWVILTGVIWLLDELHILTWSRSWPIYLIAAGVMLVFKGAFHPGYGYGYAPPPTTPQASSPVTTTSTEMVRGDALTHPGGTDQEGR